MTGLIFRFVRLLGDFLAFRKTIEWLKKTLREFRKDCPLSAIKHDDLEKIIYTERSHG